MTPSYVLSQGLLRTPAGIQAIIWSENGSMGFLGSFRPTYPAELDIVQSFQSLQKRLSSSGLFSMAFPTANVSIRM
ncbi:MAG: hypothetical protein P1P77_09110, partial [Spirochaetaceae bacterium]|nr:hypothetical protein [Spirochaetaceae bacterium]